jgi:hypothetical protein
MVFQRQKTSKHAALMSASASRGLSPRSYWIPGSWHVRMSYTDAIPGPNPYQESNGAGQYHESDRRGSVLSDGPCMTLARRHRLPVVSIHTRHQARL